jgi:hypothetical protein
MIFTAATPYSGLTASDVPADLQSEPIHKITVPGTTSNSSEQNSADIVTLSADGLKRSQDNQTGAEKTNQADQAAPAATGDKSSPTQLSPEERQAVLELKTRDAEVRAHEQAHLASAGQYAAGSASFTYQNGPDGRRYAVGGEVPIDVGKEKTPEQTIQKMRVVRQAALAPANPSSADRNIAAAASMQEAEAVRELHSQDNEPETTEVQENTAVPANTSETSPADEYRPEPVRQQDFQAIYA